jgi:hypothetical protein
MPSLNSTNEQLRAVSSALLAENEKLKKRCEELEAPKQEPFDLRTTCYTLHLCHSATLKISFFGRSYIPLQSSTICENETDLFYKEWRDVLASLIVFIDVYHFSSFEVRSFYLFSNRWAIFQK